MVWWKAERLELATTADYGDTSKHEEGECLLGESIERL